MGKGELAKLSPAPWVVQDSRDDPAPWTDPAGNFEPGVMILSAPDGIDWAIPVMSAIFEAGRFKEEPVDLAFIALARNAFDMMMRRGWYVEPLRNNRWIAVGNGWPGAIPFIRTDPFTALVEADKWYAENIDKMASPTS